MNDQLKHDTINKNRKTLTTLEHERIKAAHLAAYKRNVLMSDRPNHYTIDENFEVVDVVEWYIAQCAQCAQQAHTVDYKWVDMVKANHLAKVIEYILRAPLKNGDEDLAKAEQYLHRAIHGKWL